MNRKLVHSCCLFGAQTASYNLSNDVLLALILE